MRAAVPARHLDRVRLRRPVAPGTGRGLCAAIARAVGVTRSLVVGRFAVEPGRARTSARASAALLAGLLAVSVVEAASAQDTAVRDLLTAARRGDVAALRSALDRGAAVNATDPSFRQTALIRAAMFGQVAAARVLAAAKADVEHGASPDGMRALHWAARQGSAEMVRLLAGAGADPNATDGPGTTALEYGIAAGSAAAVRELLAAGASPEKMRRPLAALIGSALNADVPGAEVEALVVAIRAGRDLERASGHVGEGTALLALAGRANRPGAEQVARALVAAGANLRATDEKGRTARQIVEAWIPTQRNAGYRRNLEAVAAVLRGAEGQR